MDDETVTSRCACGWEMSGTEDDVVDATIEHGRRIHNMEATRGQVLATLRGNGEGEGDPRSAAEAEAG